MHGCEGMFFQLSSFGGIAICRHGDVAARLQVHLPPGILLLLGLVLVQAQAACRAALGLVSMGTWSRKQQYHFY